MALDLLQRGITDARCAAMRTIARVGNAEDIPVLIEALSDSDPYGVVRDAVEALGRLRAKDAVPELIRTLDHPEEWIALRAAYALGAIGDESAAPALESKLSPGNPRHVINAAVEALGRLRAKDAVPALIRTLDHPEVWTAVNAARALAAIGDKSAIPALQAKLSADNRLLVDAATEALKGLGDRG